MCVCRLFVPKCAQCKEPFEAGEYAMQAHDSAYHVRCFNCTVCGQALRKGDQFVLADNDSSSGAGKLLCKADHERAVSKSPAVAAASLNDSASCAQMSCSCSSEHEHEHDSVDGFGFPRQQTQLGQDSSVVMDSDSELADGQQRALGGAVSSGGKRPRTILTMTQRRKFKQAFEINPKPSRKIRESLAADTGLTVRVVQVWFQNQRAKVKKLARRHAMLAKAVVSGGKKQNACGSNASTDDQCAAGNTSFDTLLQSHEQENSDTDSLASCSSNCLNNNSKSADGNGNAYISDDKCHASATTATATGSSAHVSSNCKSRYPIDQLYSIQNKYFTT